ncbi:5'-nucleotidase [Streptomyces sp. Ncost-T6T-2b]|nr:5'-nucleotidase [Streptomyces sp. Ncost-T6T-2b]
MSATPQKNRASRRVLAAAAGLATVGALVAAMPAGAHDRGHGHGGGHGHGHKPRTVDVQLLSFNDLHGNLEPPAGSAGNVSKTHPDGTVESIPAGGVEYLATSLRTARKGNPYSVTAAGGDMVGASPLLSGLFHDEPTIEALNKLDLDVTAVGNHEFDEGATELARLQNGGCHPVEGCYEKGKKFKGADFPYLAANVTKEKTGKPLLKPYTVWKKNGVKIGFIGVTLEGTPDIVTANGVKGLKFHDEVETINKYARELDRKGVKSIVALIHEGGAPAVHLVQLRLRQPRRGRRHLRPDRRHRQGHHAEGGRPGHGPHPPGVRVHGPGPVRQAAHGHLGVVVRQALHGHHADLRPPHQRHRPYVGEVGEPRRDPGPAQGPRHDPPHRPLEQARGADREQAAGLDQRGHQRPRLHGPRERRSATSSPTPSSKALPRPTKGGAEVAFMNPGGIRADLVHKASGSEGDGVVTYGEAFTVQPFTNMMNVVDLTGAQLVTALQQQVSGPNEASPKILQVSEGLTYTLDLTKSGADRVVADTIKLNGEAIDPARTYRVAMNEFLAGGGDGFPALGEGTNKLVGASDLDLFNAYLAAHSSATAPLAPPATDRITVIQ